MWGYNIFYKKKKEKKTEIWRNGAHNTMGAARGFRHRIITFSIHVRIHTLIHKYGYLNFYM